ncbi:MAG: hypothetical protein L3K07_06430, partial [Thermoplasmata archaeon]|nr:hypothetical protein [Thermoplasmata archaeon]
MYHAVSRLRARAASLAVVLLMLAVLPGLTGAHSAPSPARPTPAAPPSVEVTNALGAPAQYFYVGLGTGDVYFHAYDLSGDTIGVVAINDLNASRDGLTNPVAHWTANFSMNPNNYSYLWHAHLELPLGLSQGGRWNVTLTGTHAGFVSRNFTVGTFTVSATPFRGVYVPGHVASVLISVTRSVSGALFQPTKLTLTGSYLLQTNLSTVSLFSAPRVLGPSSYIVTTFTVPLNAAIHNPVFLSVWANYTTASGTESQSSGTEFSVGVLSVSLSLSLSNHGPFVSVLPANSPAILTISVSETDFFTYSAGDNLSVAISFQGPNGNLASIPGNPPLALRTDSDGLATVLFTSSNQTFQPMTPYTIWVNVTDPVGPAKRLNNTLSFTVLPAVSSSEALG